MIRNLIIFELSEHSIEDIGRYMGWFEFSKTFFFNPSMWPLINKFFNLKLVDKEYNKFILLYKLIQKIESFWNCQILKSFESLG